jgi:hypothetical protein
MFRNSCCCSSSNFTPHFKIILVYLLFVDVSFYQDYHYCYYYYSLTWNSVTITPERVQRKCAVFCHNRSFQDVDYYYDSILKKLDF